MVEILLDCGTCVDVRDSKGATALKLAIVNNQLEIVKILLRRGADPSSPSDLIKGRVTALQIALVIGSQEIQVVLQAALVSK